MTIYNLAHIARVMILDVFCQKVSIQSCASFCVDFLAEVGFAQCLARLAIHKELHMNDDIGAFSVCNNKLWQNLTVNLQSSRRLLC